MHSDADSHAARISRRTTATGEGDADGPDAAPDGTPPPPAFDDMRSSAVGREDGAAASSGSGGKVTEVIDCRETAPAAASYDMYVDGEGDGPADDASTTGGLSVAVPGELRGLELAHYRHGSLPWRDLVRPAMELARDGYLVSRHLAQDVKDNAESILRFPHLASALSRDNDGVTLLTEGDVLKRPRLAETLERVMRDGADAVYTGGGGRGPRGGRA